METEFKSGFVGLVGPTNSGKSTLLNALVGQKVSIVSSRSQTTYHKVSGVVNEPGNQIVFVDLPGFQRYDERVARLLNRVADRGASECDLMLWIFDASSDRVVDQIRKLQDKIESLGKTGRRLLALNKVDQVKDKRELLPLLQEISALNWFDEILPISALKKDGLDRLLSAVRQRLQAGPQFYPEGHVTDRNEQFLVAELIRERVYRDTYQEIPYSVRVEIEGWETTERVPIIRALIHVDSTSRRGILIGKRGSMLKQIGSEARKEIEKLLGYQVCLKLFVDVENEWQGDERVVNRYLELGE